MLTRIIVILAALLPSSAVRAEGGTCPPGYYPMNSPGVSGCAPIPGSGGSEEPEPSGPRWRKQWIALAIDTSVGAVGVALDQPSKSAAKKESVRQCINNGGTVKGCELLAATWNQCLSMAWGDGYTTTFGAPNNSDAMNGAMDQCSKRAKNCKVIFINCSWGVRAD